MTQLKHIRQHNHSLQNHADKTKVITHWLTSTITSKGVFCSLRWHKNTPVTDTQLIIRLHNTLNKLFQELLGSHWFKLYQRHFNLVVVKEKGKSLTNYHSHIALGIKSDKFTINDIITAFKNIEKKIKMEVYVKNKGEEVNLLHTYPDNVVITPIYDVSGVSEYISKEFETSESDSMSFASADTIIFDYQIFN